MFGPFIGQILTSSTLDTLQTSLAASEPAEGGEEGISAFVIAILLFFAIYFLLGLYGFSRLEKYKFIHAIPESVFVIFLGAILGGFIEIIDKFTPLKPWESLKFSPHNFFLLILPPIIFDSGYRIPDAFYSNLGAIIVFAVLGTIISTICVGGVLAALAMNTTILPPELTFASSMAFGAMLSAVDPVASLAIFQSLGADPNLFALVFGESLLNDAIAITLFRTFDSFSGRTFEWSLVVNMIKDFSISTAASLGIGLVIGVIAALLFKHLRLSRLPAVELAVFYCINYQAYLICEGLHYSGIMGLLMSSIMANRFLRPSLSPRALVITTNLNHALAFSMESIVFLYLGMCLWSSPFVFDYALVLITFGLIIVGRAFNIFPLTWLVNICRKKEKRISWRFSVVQFYSGLRGAIAFALSLGISVADPAVLVTTTLVITLATIIIFGITTGPLMGLLHLRGTNKASPVEPPRRSTSEGPTPRVSHDNDQRSGDGFDHAPAVHLDAAVEALHTTDHAYAEELRAAALLDSAALEGLYLPRMGAVLHTQTPGVHGSMPSSEDNSEHIVAEVADCPVARRSDTGVAPAPTGKAKGKSIMDKFENAFLRPLLVKDASFSQTTAPPGEFARVYAGLAHDKITSTLIETNLRAHNTLHGTDALMGTSVIPAMADAADVARMFLHLPTKHFDVLNEQPVRTSEGTRPRKLSMARSEHGKTDMDALPELTDRALDSEEEAELDIQALPLYDRLAFMHYFTVHAGARIDSRAIRAAVRRRRQQQRQQAQAKHETDEFGELDVMDYIESITANNPVSKHILHGIDRAERNTEVLRQRLELRNAHHAPSGHMSADAFFELPPATGSAAALPAVVRDGTLEALPPMSRGGSSTNLHRTASSANLVSSTSRVGTAPRASHEDRMSLVIPIAVNHAYDQRTGDIELPAMSPSPTWTVANVGTWLTRHLTRTEDENNQNNNQDANQHTLTLGRLGLADYDDQLTKRRLGLGAADYGLGQSARQQLRGALCDERRRHMD